MQKALTLLFILCYLLANSNTISKAYEALEEYDYFKAKKLFYKSYSKKRVEAAYGLATIFYRNDNPFSNTDSAAKYIAIAKTHIKDTIRYSSYHINTQTINELMDAISQKGFDKYTSKNTTYDYNYYLCYYYFSKDSLLQKVRYLRDNNSLAYYSNYESSDSMSVFLDTYPESELYDRAKKIFYTFQYIEQTKNISIITLKKFIKQYPRNPNTISAEKKLFDLVKELHQPDSLYHFIKYYSTTITKEEAWKLLYSTSVKTYSKESLTQFISTYTDYPYSIEVLKEIALEQTQLIPLKNNNSKMGYADTTGNWIIKPLYDDASNFSEGFAAVCINDSCFYINKENAKICVDYFDEIEDFKNGKAIVKKNKDYFLMNRSGQIITSSYQDINEGFNDLYVCKQHNLYGAINTKGEIIIPFIYTKLGNFKTGYAYYLSDKYGLVDASNYALKAQWDWVSDVDANTLVCVKKSNKYGLITLNEQVLLNAEYDFISACANGIYLVVKNELYGFYNATEKCFVTAIQYDYQKEFDNEYYTNGKQFKLLKNDEVALVDANGRQSINFGTYDNLFFAKCDVIRIIKNNKYGFVDRKLKTIIPTEYNEATDFENDVAIVTKKETTQLITKINKVLFSIKNGEITKLNSELYKITTTNLVGLINKKGELVLPIEYSEIEPINDYLYRCTKVDDSFLFNLKTKIFTKL